MHHNTTEQAALVTDPALIVKNAKASLHALREALKAKDPWDKDVEFHRQNTRRLYLQLILCFPYAPQAHPFDNPMWIETSHAFIAVYRQRIANLEKVINARAEKAAASSSPKARKQDTGPVELRKLIQRFRQFLADEERFWIGFVLRFARSFALSEAKPTFAALNLNRFTDDPNRRNVFPDEGKPTPPPTEKERERKIMTLVKGLICLGDLARYREQYNESGGRPKAGHEDVLPRWATKATRKPGDWTPRPRNYNRALAFYTQARLLFPDAGNASHQLAIVSSYQSDPFASVLHYYRSLCVRLPFHMALDNLDKTLARNMDSGIKQQAIPPDDTEQPRLVVDRFKKDVVLLHALWRTEEEIQQRYLSSHSDYVLERFSKLLAERLLPIGLIVKIYVSALGALWTLRMFRRGSKAAKELTSDTKEAKERPEPNQMEAVVLTHVIRLHLALVRIAHPQLEEEAVKAPTGPAAERITAILRRSLQTLRVASKWLRANLEYLSRASTLTRTTPDLTAALAQFWPAYAEMLTLLARVFPTDQLQGINVKLEEEIELSGFSPMKGSLDTNSTGPAGQVHPNDEYLLRISDILIDAVLIADADVTPLKVMDGVYTAEVRHVVINTPTILARTNGDDDEQRPRRDSLEQQEIIPGEAGAAHAEDIDELGSLATRTDDDPVAMAMRVSLHHQTDGLDDDDLDDEEEILYERRANTSWPSNTLVPARGPPTPILSPSLVDPFHRASGPTPVISQMNYGQSPIQPPVVVTQGQVAQPSALRDSYGPVPGAMSRGPPPVNPYSTSTSMSMGMGGPPPPNPYQPHTDLRGSMTPIQQHGYPQMPPNFGHGHSNSLSHSYGHTSSPSQPFFSNMQSPIRNSFGPIPTAPVVPNGSGPRNYVQAPVPPPSAPLPSMQQSPSFLPQIPQTHHRPSTSISSMVVPPGGPGGVKTTQDLLMRVLGGSGALSSITRPSKEPNVDIGVIGSGLHQAPNGSAGNGTSNNGPPNGTTPRAQPLYGNSIWTP